MSVDVLLVEDNEDHVALFRAQLSSAGAGDIQVHVARTLQEALAYLNGRNAGADVVVLDLGLPDATGLSGLDALIGRPGGAPPIVVLTTLDNERLAHSAVQRGAQDYLPKWGITGASLLRSVRYAQERWVTSRKRESLLTELQAAVDAHEDARKELDHRVRNLLSVVHSLANHTAWTTGAAGTFMDVFGGRLRQLASVHEALAQRRWRELDALTLLRSTLAPHLHAGQVELVGAVDAVLKSKIVRSMALALHELYTNAIKYGALASPKGLLRVELVACEHDLTLVWQEQRAEPPVQTEHTTSKQGHGLVVNLIERDLGGKVELSMRGEGLYARLEVRDALQVRSTDA